MQVLMLAAENGAIEGAKVGGMADVIRDLPLALTNANQDVSCHLVMPAFGKLITNANATWVAQFEVPFAGRMEMIDIYQSHHPQAESVRFFFLSHPLFQGQYKGVYSQGSAERPFAEDATKFALFSMASATALLQGLLPMPDVLHLHDWHMAMFAMLVAFEPKFVSLKSLKLVYTIHNLALQGIRPIDFEASSFEAWFPQLWRTLSLKQRQQVIDPRYPNCVNPMRMGINLAHKVHLVSPTYVEEVLRKSEPELGFFGGEGLEADLQLAASQGKLVGILNGCHLDDKVGESLRRSNVQPKESKRWVRGLSQSAKRKAFAELLDEVEGSIITSLAQFQWVRSQDQIALSRVNQFRCNKYIKSGPKMLLTSVGRLTNQKVLLLRQTLDSGVCVLEQMLKQLACAQDSGLFIMLGSGDDKIADEFTQIAARYSNFLFMNTYDEKLSTLLYRLGDLFVMPSSFEPCGISQMLALSQGQLCLVHGVGGLRDTVLPGQYGFVFNGKNLTEQGKALLSSVDEALELFDSQIWLNMEQAALQAKFDWQTQVPRYLKELYS